MINMRFGLSGHYRLRKGITMPDGSEVTTGQTDWFHNLITDRGVEAIGEGAASNRQMLSACQVGTGSTPASVTDTALAAHLATTTATSKADVLSVVTGPPSYGSRVVTFRFAQGAAAGNLTEVGIGYTTAVGGLLYSRALITDSTGSPTVLPVLPIEFLDVEYEARLYVPAGDSVYNILVGSTPTVVTARPAYRSQTRNYAQGIPGVVSNSDSYTTQQLYASGSLGPETGGPSGTLILAGTRYAFDAYSAGSHKLTCAIPYGIASANQDIYSVVVLSSLGCYQFAYNPPIAKDNTKTMTLRYQLSGGRYTP